LRSRHCECHSSGYPNLVTIFFRLCNLNSFPIAPLLGFVCDELAKVTGRALLKYSKTNQESFFDAMNTLTGRRALRRARC
jgi:hypothetical protein